MKYPILLGFTSLSLTLFTLFSYSDVFARAEPEDPIPRQIQIALPDGSRATVDAADFVLALSSGQDSTLSAVAENGAIVAVSARDAAVLPSNASAPTTALLSCGTKVQVGPHSPSDESRRLTAIDELFELDQASKKAYSESAKDVSSETLKGVLKLGKIVLDQKGSFSQTETSSLEELEPNDPRQNNPADQRVIEQAYAEVTLPEIKARLDLSTREIERTLEEVRTAPIRKFADVLDHLTPPEWDVPQTELPTPDALTKQREIPLSRAERFRYERLLSNALDRAEEAKRALEELDKNPTLASQPRILDEIPAVSALLKSSIPPSPPPSGRSPASIPSPSESKNNSTAATASTFSASTPEDLIKRTILFAGLPQKQKEQTAALIKNKTLLRGGIPLLHLGDLTPTENKARAAPQMKPKKSDLFEQAEEVCTRYAKSLVRQAITPESRKYSLTTADYRAIWIYRRSGLFPKIPKYPDERKVRIQQIADQFEAIDLYDYEPLQEGDLLIYRLAWEPSGRAFVVKHFEPATLQLKVLDLSSSEDLRPIRGQFSLALQSQSKPGRTLASLGNRHLPGGSPRPAIKPGFYALRLRPIEVSRCIERVQKKLASRTPASAPSQKGPVSLK